MQYYQNQSLQSEDLEQTKREVADQADDSYLEMTSFKYTLKPQVKFEIQFPKSEILIAVSKFQQVFLRDWCHELEINLQLSENGLIISTDKDQSFKDILVNQIKQVFCQYQSRQLNYDKECLKAIYPSNYILNQLLKQNIYLVKQKILDNSIKLHLVSKSPNLNIIADNLEYKLRGIRIFFQDCVGHMTFLQQNKDYYNCLTQLRLAYYQKVGNFELEQNFNNIVFKDVIDKKQSHSSLIMGFNLAYQLEAKQNICQNLFKYVSNYIKSWFAIFIYFEQNKTNIKNANILVDLMNNAEDIQFLCASQIFSNISSIGLIGHPNDIIKLINETLLPNQNKFDEEFVKTLKISVLESNFNSTASEIQASFDSVENNLSKKPQIQVTKKQTLISFKLTSKASMKNYCKIIRYICEQKYDQSTKQTEQKLNELLSYFQEKQIYSQKEGELFQNLNMNNSQQQKKEQSKQQPIPLKITEIKLKESTQSKQSIPAPKKDTQTFSGFSTPIENQLKSTSSSASQQYSGQQKIKFFDSQKSELNSKGQTNSQNQPSYISKFSKHEESNVALEQDQQDDNQLFIPNIDMQNNEEELKKKDFYFNIIEAWKESNNRAIVHQKYKEYFSGLYNNELNLTGSFEGVQQDFIGYICLRKKDVFSLKCFDRSLKIYKNPKDAISYCQTQWEETFQVIQVLIYKYADKANSISYEDEYDDSFELKDSNQIYPIKLIEF